jgi:methylphosphotriester-DNA--protein-cysteine methyltransferase
MQNFQRRFSEYVGISPKLYARIVRFELVLKAKAAAPNMTWMNASHQVGYHDQMHMVHDFREFSADTPTGIFRRAEQLLVPPADFVKAACAR